MFIRPSTIIFSAIALAGAVAAAPNADLSARGGGSSQCDTGSIQCCNSVQDATSSPVTLLAGLLGISLSGITGQVGLTCSPITGIGIGGTSCVQQPVCCTGNNFSGLIVIGCTPITL